MVLERTMIPRIAAYIGVSHAECEFAARLGISNEQIHLIPNGVRVNALVSKVRGQVTEIGFIGRLIPEKGADRLPDLARRLSGGVTLHVAGDGLLRHTLEGLANVVLHGWVEDGISEFLAGLQVLVLPSRKEGLPYALLEAMERAVPAVAMGVGGLRDVISDRVDGRLVPEGDLPAMSGALAELIDNPDEATSMGRAARATVEQRYTLSKMVERTQAVYASAIKGAGAAWKA